ncbi:hypothetical protein [Flavisolibacter tropicus]|uniref:Uncharacterized protein n=1 Tax=Flavisolibacter tropicus TaxID=1492898 RepID=A0A172TSM5_9BACT|nr:hypothetical protein [Flavisolibacter tropicus]ANE49996.1 hypothetical protein SY85_05290 [Flavisolibacter tropicus]
MNHLFKCLVVAQVILAVSTPAFSQNEFAFTRAVNRSQHDQYLKDSMITRSLQVPLSTTTEKEWQKAFWAMELMLYKTTTTKNKLSEAWQKADTLSEGFQKSLLEVSYTLYPDAFKRPVTHLLHSTVSPSVFIRAAEYIWLTDQSKQIKRMLQKQMAQKFKESNYIGLTLLQQRLNRTNQKRPPIEALFDSNFLTGQTIIYSLQRSNRNFPGLVLIRKPNGQFVRNHDGSFFFTTQLARAITNYPYYITNGNTPQGLLRWTGFDSSSNNYIGPTTNLQLVLPYEATPAIFLANNRITDTVWMQNIYTNLLPDSWKSYHELYESFWAGAIGRSEIIMHGTTINPLYYKGQPYFPQTPSLGCLCSYEAWDTNGRLIESNQEQIVRTLISIGSTNGYVIVINLDDQNKAVRLNEVMHLVK